MSKNLLLALSLPLFILGCGSSPPVANQAQSNSAIGVINVDEPDIKDSLTYENADLGSCHMDSCSWSVEVSRQLVGSNKNGRLYELTLFGGTSDNIVDVEQNVIPVITWNEKPHNLFVLCSTKTPAVAMAVDGGYQVDVLDFSEDGYIPSVLESSAEIYNDVCGNTKNEDAYDETLVNTEITTPRDLLNLSRNSVETEGLD